MRRQRSPESYMVHVPWLWAAFTIIAAAGQTARNAMQRELAATLGTGGLALQCQKQ